MNILASNLHIPGIGSEPGPVTARAWDRRSVAAEHYAHVQLIALPFQVFEKLLHSLRLPFSVPEHLLDILGQVFVGEGEIDPAPFHEGNHWFLHQSPAGFVPGSTATWANRFLLSGNDRVGVVRRI